MSEPSSSKDQNHSPISGVIISQKVLKRSSLLTVYLKINQIVQRKILGETSLVDCTSQVGITFKRLFRIPADLQHLEHYKMSDKIFASSKRLYILVPI